MRFSYLFLISCIAVNIYGQCLQLQKYASVTLLNAQSTCFWIFSNESVTIVAEEISNYNLTAKVSTQGSYNDFDYLFINYTATLLHTYQVAPTIYPRKLFFLLFNLGVYQTYNFTTQVQQQTVKPLIVDTITHISLPKTFTSYYYINIEPGNTLSMYFIPTNAPIMLCMGKGEAWDAKQNIACHIATNSTPFAYTNSTDVFGGIYYLGIFSQNPKYYNSTNITYRLMQGVARMNSSGPIDIIVPGNGDRFYFQNFIAPMTDLYLYTSSKNHFDIYAKNGTSLPTTQNYDFVSLNRRSLYVSPNPMERTINYMVTSSNKKTTLARGIMTINEIKVRELVDFRDYQCVSTPTTSPRPRDYYMIKVPANGTLVFTVYMEKPAETDTLFVSIDTGSYNATPFFVANAVNPQLTYKNKTEKTEDFIIIVENKCHSCVGYCIIANDIGRGPYITLTGKIIALTVASVLGSGALIIGITIILLCILIHCHVIKLNRKKDEEKIQLIVKTRDGIVDENFQVGGYYTSSSGENQPNINDLKQPLLINEIS